MFLAPANEVWGKVIFLHLFVIRFTRGGCLLLGVGACSRVGVGVSGPGGVPAPGGWGLVPGGLVSGWDWSWGVGAWMSPRMDTAVGGTHPTGIHSCMN